MISPVRENTLSGADITNGSGAAAILSAGIGCFVLAILALAADKSIAIKNVLIFYKPTGALSGVTSTSIFIWILTWGVFEWRWKQRSVAIHRIAIISFMLLLFGLLLTFPPITDLF